MTDRLSEQEIDRIVERLERTAFEVGGLGHSSHSARAIRQLRGDLATADAAIGAASRELQAVFVALNPECPACPGIPNPCQSEMCDCFGADNMGQQVTALRAELARVTAERDALEGRLRTYTWDCEADREMEL